MGRPERAALPDVEGVQRAIIREMLAHELAQQPLMRGQLIGISHLVRFAGEPPPQRVARR